MQPQKAHIIRQAKITLNGFIQGIRFCVIKHHILLLAIMEIYRCEVGMVFQDNSFSFFIKNSATCNHSQSHKWWDMQYNNQIITNFDCSISRIFIDFENLLSWFERWLIQICNLIPCGLYLDNTWKIHNPISS